MVLGIYGSGGAGKEVKDIAEMLNKWSEIVFIDDTVDCDEYYGINRMPWNDFTRRYPIDESEVVISIGEPGNKKILRDKIEIQGYSLTNIIHPLAWVSPSARIGNGVILRAGAIVNACAQIGNNTTLMEYSCVGHDTVVGSDCQISGLVIVGGPCKVGNSVYIGMSVPVKEKITIGDNSIIGMGSVCSRDIADKVVALGNPARAIKKCDDNTRVFD